MVRLPTNSIHSGMQKKEKTLKISDLAVLSDTPLDLGFKKYNKMFIFNIYILYKIFSIRPLVIL